MPITKLVYCFYIASICNLSSPVRAEQTLDDQQDIHITQDNFQDNLFSKSSLTWDMVIHDTLYSFERSDKISSFLQPVICGFNSIPVKSVRTSSSSLLFIGLMPYPPSVFPGVSFNLIKKDNNINKLTYSVDFTCKINQSNKEWLAGLMFSFLLGEWYDTSIKGFITLHFIPTGKIYDLKQLIMLPLGRCINFGAIWEFSVFKISYSYLINGIENELRQALTGISKKNSSLISTQTVLISISISTIFLNNTI